MNNCFHNISFEGYDKNNDGATPAEILHPSWVIQIYSKRCGDDIHSVGIRFNIPCYSGNHEDSRRQSKRDLPDVGPFHNGLMYVKLLKATARFARVYCLFLYLCQILI